MKKIFLMFILMSGLLVQAQTYSVRVVKDNLFIPWEIIYGPDNHIWFTQKSGYICRLNPADGDLDTLYHETQTAVVGEGGMLGMALHPDFPTTPYLYVAYNYNDASVYKQRIVRYTYNGSTAVGSPFTLIDNITAGNIHNGSRLVIVGDKLFISTGDAGTASLAQQTTSISGKVLRVNLDGSIPSDNPIAGSAVWNWGQRNIQGMTYANGKLYSSMHGANSNDEINILVANRNYGWPDVEGYCNTTSEVTFCNANNVVEPIEAWTPTIAVCGLDYYDHAMYPNLQGSLIMATLKDQHLYQLKLNGTYDDITNINIISQVSQGRLRDVCISPQGSIFISTSNSNSNGSNHIDKIIEVYDPTVTSVNRGNNDLLTLYPNPVQEQLYVSAGGKEGEACTYNLYDVSGRKMVSGNAAFPFYISTENLDKGMYILECHNEAGESFMKKVVKR